MFEKHVFLVILIIAVRTSGRENIMCWGLDFYFLCNNMQVENIKAIFVFIMMYSLRNDSIIEL